MNPARSVAKESKAMTLARLAVMLLVWLALAGCATKDETLPPVPPMPEDLSVWTVPELVQPDDAQRLAERKRPATAAETVYDYVPGGVYKLVVGLDAPLDILLEPGERVQSLTGRDPKPLLHRSAPPVQGSEPPGAAIPEPSKVRWEYKEAMSGAGESASAHVLLSAFEANATLGLTMTTSHRVYYLMCKSVQVSLVRVVRWYYGGDPDGRKASGEKRVRLVPLPDEPRRYHVGYQIEGNRAGIAWVPRAVVDDGKKLYLLYPEITLFKTAPLVRAVGPQGPQILNSLQWLNVVIIDSLPSRVELRVGPDMKDAKAEVVTITQGTLKTIECPGDPDCPVWPAAAQQLGGRRP
jgi:type IV secretory pathway VirB9-like protein